MQDKPKKMPKVRVQEVQPDLDYGLYLWKLPTGRFFKDEDGNYLNIPGLKGDLEKTAIIRKAAAYYGQPEGSPYFLAGGMRATEEEYSEQVDRLKQGYIPSMNDVGAVVDAKKSAAKHGDDE